jgi:hypothetical protein
MAMTITPANDFAINQQGQAATRPSQENQVARVGDKNSSVIPGGGKAVTDSVALSTAAENLASSGSLLTDFDQAQGAMAKLKNTIYSQAGQALQTQANISSKSAFALLND